MTMPRAVRYVVPIALLFVSAYGLVSARHAYQAKRFPYLTGVVEPIDVIEGSTSDHDGTWAIQFKDARGVIRELQLDEAGSIWLIGSREVIPKAGDEEKALLGVLERWVRSDPEAMQIDLKADLTEESRELEGKEVGVAILRVLRGRN